MTRASANKVCSSAYFLGASCIRSLEKWSIIYTIYLGIRQERRLLDASPLTNTCSLLELIESIMHIIIQPPCACMLLYICIYAVLSPRPYIFQFQIVCFLTSLWEMALLHDTSMADFLLIRPNLLLQYVRSEWLSLRCG